MPNFRYSARGSHGDSINGTVEADSSSSAAAQLIQSGLTPIEIRPDTVEAPVIDGLNRLFQPKVDNTDLIQFCRQMHSMLRAGIPIFRAVDGLAGTTGNVMLKNSLRGVMADLEAGHTLSYALGQQPNVFSEFFVGLVRVGETAGKLQEIFRQLAFYLDRDHVTKAKIKSALRYPTIVITAISIALGVISIFVIPAFNSLFSSFGAELPLPTRILMVISEFMVAYWLFVVSVLGIGIYATHYYVNTQAGKYKWDKLKLNLPLVGSVVYKASLARFSHLFSMAINSGVPLVTALTVVANALNNSFLEERLLGMRSGVEQGKSLSITATNSGIFDPLVLQMLTVGEETGTTGELLAEVADYYDREVNYASERLSAAIEPLLTVVIGGMLLVMAMGIFLPMWDLASVALH